MLKAIDFASEFGIFSGKIFSVIVFGESDFDCTFLADLRADKLFFKARNKFMGANIKRLVFSFAAREFFAVDSAGVIERDKIAVNNGVAFCRVD